MPINLFSNHSSIRDGKKDLAEDITRAGSKQTYYTLRLLADRDRVQDALRAYAYFRWLDDQLDTEINSQAEKAELLRSQKDLLDQCFQAIDIQVSLPEEQLLVDLVRNNPAIDSGLYIYLYNMMNVMSFDVERRGRKVTKAELANYSLMLSKAVTEYMFYFIGHDDPPPQGPARYQAVIGAHVVHMLRDMLCDLEVGYFNFPAELQSGGHTTRVDFESPEFRSWVHERVQLAHQCFNDGRVYIARVKNFRCRLAGFAYLARFEWMVRTIEKDQYCLRQTYPERKKIRVLLWMAWYVAALLLKFPRRYFEPAELEVFPERCEE